MKQISLPFENSPSLVSAKRGRNERSGLHGWHPYYAGYSESFVDSAISYLELNKNSLILDPWNGSGTTALVSNQKEICSIGTDINPVMNLFSLAKSGYVVANAHYVKEYFNEIKSIISKQTISVSAGDRSELYDWMSPSVANVTLGILNAIYSLDLPNYKLDPKINSALQSGVIPYQHPIKAFLIASLFVTVRQLAGYGGGSNPTWTRSIEHKEKYSKKDILRKLEDNVDGMLLDLRQANLHPTKKLNSAAVQADSRKLPIKAKTIDGIITSPPYLTRIDYAMSTAPELLLLEGTSFLRETRELTMGAPVIVDKTIEVNPLWGKKVGTLLDGVKNHASKSASNYYYVNMLQYYRDAEKSLSEISRVLKPKAKALVVVQSSYFKELEIDLGNMYVEMAENLGLKSSIAFREVVKGHMAHVNTKSKNYKAIKVFHEDVVELTRDK